MKIIFEKLADEIQNATFSYEDFNVLGKGFSRLTISTYLLEVSYKGNYIRIKNEFGNHNLGTVELIIKNRTLPEFEIKSGNHFFNLFLPKRKMINVYCKNYAFKKFLEKKLIDSKLEQIAQNNLFEPKITNNTFEFNSTIQTLYHLEFEDKIGALKALINFHKELIDY
ncbi:hypothetical protein ACFSX9_12825 [Flavobacterium ardleyense]|uniref:Uncharacterized protein n=1 Tax=Flavobacterium ardleyense TaxID=2038737 RepID=A0ABW5Z9T7_9FLAO